MNAPEDRGRVHAYALIIESVFSKHYKKGDHTIHFERPDLVTAAEKLGIKPPKNLGDIIYTFRYRAPLPERILQAAPPGKSWIIRPAGRSKYKFEVVTLSLIEPTPGLSITRIPDSTPGIIERHALTDEQALLAVVRYNRLIDLFTGLTCYSLQSHLRTTLRSMGQVEVDELYLGLDRHGVQYAIPVQAKGGSDVVSVVQIEQDLAVCAQRFPHLVSRAVAVLFSEPKVVAMFELEETPEGITIADEKHFKLVAASEITTEELKRYHLRLSK